MKSTLTVFLIASAITRSAIAQDNIPSIVTDGLTAYQKAGAKTAVLVWLKGSNTQNETSSMEGVLNQIETAYGKMVGFEVVRVVSVSPSFQRVYVLIKYEGGPGYASFDCYRTPVHWIIPQLGVFTRPNEVWPADLLSGSK